MTFIMGGAGLGLSNAGSDDRSLVLASGSFVVADVGFATLGNPGPFPPNADNDGCCG